MNFELGIWVLYNFCTNHSRSCYVCAHVCTWCACGFHMWKSSYVWKFLISKSFTCLKDLPRES